MKKSCLIVCWYGKFPDYFKLWELSCSYNSDYDFLIFTDQDYTSTFKNIKIFKKSLSEINELFSKKLGLEIEIEKPYKFCDFRPAYGVIFSDYLTQYEFWGHCDLDQVFGNINSFITEDILNNYEKINKNGHFVLYKNSDKINNLFKKDGVKFSYKEVFSNKENYAFDEYTGINTIVEREKVKLYCTKQYADINVKYKRYTLFELENYNEQVFTFEDGRIFRYYIDDNEIKKEEFMYLHFQKKKPNIISIDATKTIVIGSKGIESIDNCIDKNIINEFNPYKGLVFEFFETIKYLILKVHQFVKCSAKQKKIWIKQKI